MDVVTSFQFPSSAPAATEHAKRCDIQGLRTVAITGVFLYHLWPDMFPFGFYGVDMFFVISGFLMAKTMRRRKGPTLAIVQSFYTSRLRRIVPIYLTILVALLVSSNFFLFDDHRFEHAEMLSAVGFVSNIAFYLKRKSYFSPLHDWAFLRHTWSLSVEMQFYIIVPLIFVGINKSIRCAVFLLSILCASSFYAHCLSSDDTAFLLLPCRLWQFLAGIISFMIVEFVEQPLAYEEALRNEPFPTAKVTACKHHASYCIVVMQCLLMVSSCHLTPIVHRFAVTVLTAAQLYAGKEVSLWLMCNKTIVYVGDVSYILYLVHWPIILYGRYYSQEYNLDLFDGTLIILASGFIACWLHHCIDQRYQRVVQPLRVAKMLMAIYICTSVAIYANYVVLKPGKGKLKFMMVGDSHSIFSFHGVSANLQDVYSDFRLYVRSGKVAKIYHDHFTKEFAIHQTRLAVAYQQFVDRMSRHTRLLLIGGPNIQLVADGAREIRKRLWQNLPLENVHISLDHHLKFHNGSYALVRGLRCAKCVILDWAKVFCKSERNICLAFDETSEVAFFHDATHYSLLGSLTLGPFVKEVFMHNLELIGHGMHVRRS